MNTKPKYEENNKLLTRSHNYREKYFKENKGHLRRIFKSGLFVCPYCGKFMINRSKIAIDHIYPIRCVQYTKRLRERFKALPDGVNDISNLVACCKRCNLRKGKKLGIYPSLARFGIYFMPVIRMIRWACLLLIIGFTLFIFIT